MIKRVARLIRRLKGRPAPNPDWYADSDELEGWQAVRSLQSARSQLKRRKRLWLGLVLASLPIAIGSCALSMIARGTALTARSLSDDAVTLVSQETEALPTPDFVSQATAVLQHRLLLTGHPLRKALMIRHNNYSTNEYGETHRFDLVHNGRIALEALVTTDAQGSIGVFFEPPNNATGYNLASFYTPQEAVQGLTETFGLADHSEDTENSQNNYNIVYDSLTSGGLTVSDYLPDLAVDTLPSGMLAKTEEWLIAWSNQNVAAMRELGNITSDETIETLAFSDHVYVPGSLNVLGTLSQEGFYFLHTRFILQGPSQEMLAQDLWVIAQTEGTLVRILEAQTVGGVS